MGERLALSRNSSSYRQIGIYVPVKRSLYILLGSVSCFLYRFCYSPGLQDTFFGCWHYEFGPLDANFARFCFILPLQISLISWPIGRPPAERPGIPKGWNPFGHNETTFKIFKKRQLLFYIL